VRDVRDASGAVLLRAGDQLSRFLDTRADGTTLSGNWLYIGMYTNAGNLTQRRSYADSSGVGRYPEWTFSWPANRRILYNRCSADGEGRPWDPERVGIAWDGRRWIGDTPDYTVDSPPAANLGAFIMLPEGVARLFVPGQFVEGPWSEHYEPAESPVLNPLHPTQSTNPALQLFGTEFDVLGLAREYPIVCTTYRLTEHFHYWTKNNPYTMQLQPEFFVEMPEQLAREKQIANGDMVRVTSARGAIEGRAMVTRRIKPLQISGQTVYQIGFPIHWGFLGRGKQQGSLADGGSPPVVEPNSIAPEERGWGV
jgi:formate dehydrogenase major subunit